jgi:hypothetical protein
MACLHTVEKKTKRSDNATNESCLTRAEIMLLHELSARLESKKMLYQMTYNAWVSKIFSLKNNYTKYKKTHPIPPFNLWKKWHDDLIKSFIDIISVFERFDIINAQCKLVCEIEINNLNRLMINVVKAKEKMDACSAQLHQLQDYTKRPVLACIASFL